MQKSLINEPTDKQLQAQDEFATPAGDMLLPKQDEPDQKIEFLNKILRGELSAVDAYDRVISKFGAEMPQLETICQEHKANIESLELFVQRNAFTPSSDSGIWGTLVKTVINGATFIGNQTSAQALIEGEEYGLRQYRQALQFNLTTPERATIEDRIIPSLERHIATLRAMENVH